MNIFYLDEDTWQCARYHCNRHVVKMPIETAQILSTVWHKGDPDRAKDMGIFKPTHKNHPCVKWAGKTRGNYTWALVLGIELCVEYERRYKKTHRVLEVFDNLAEIPPWLDDEGMTEPALCMPESCKILGDPMGSYRKYYRQHKSMIANYPALEWPSWML